MKKYLTKFYTFKFVKFNCKILLWLFVFGVCLMYSFIMNIVCDYFIQKNRFEVYYYYNEARDAEKVKLLTRKDKLLRVLSQEYTKQDINKLIDDCILYKQYINIKTLTKKGCQFSVFHSETHRYTVVIDCADERDNYLYYPVFKNLSNMERFIKKAFS